MLDEGIEVKGPVFDEHGKLLRRGDVIAAMEGIRYGSQVKALQAQLEASRRELQAAKAKQTLVAQALPRQKGIFSRGLNTQQKLDEAQSDFDQTNAMVAAQQATVRAVQQQLNTATEDLGDAVLYAPFSGRITVVHAAEGTVVSAGAAVVTLTLMDPMRIQVEVSADEERKLETGEQASLLVKDPFDNTKIIPIKAIVYEKSTVADANLRTFRVDLLARNSRRHQYHKNPGLKHLPNINKYLPVVKEYAGESGPLFIANQAIFTEDNQDYVLKLPGVSLNNQSKKSALGKHMPEKIAVNLIDEYLTVVNWNFRGINNVAQLQEGDFLIANPQKQYLDGVTIGRPQWLLRPKDLLTVQFDLGKTSKGFYLPHRAILLKNGQNIVYRIENGHAIATVVELAEMSGELRRIISPELGPNSQVVLAGVHYISDGQAVNIIEAL